MKSIHKSIIIIVMTTLMGQLYFQPFNTDFRFSLGVVTMTLLILVLKERRILLTCGEVGFFVILFRTLIDCIGSHYPLDQVFLKHLPVIGFYLIFGLLFQILISLKHHHNPIRLVFWLTCIDTFSNIIELIIRANFPWSITKLLPILQTLLFVGVIRSLLSASFYVFIQYNNIIILKKEQYNHYRQLLLFTANLKAESLYLQKNMTDTENAMTKSYAIYEQLTNLEDTSNNPTLLDIQKKLLSLTAAIHEIKKNDFRVLSGIKKLIPLSENRTSLFLSEIIQLIFDNSKRLAETFDKDIHFTVDIKRDIKIQEYYHLFSIINNLVINSIDAISEFGQIYIKASVTSSKLILKVIDSGEGISEDDLPVIFAPGFSTKFDPFSGNQSTGLGLTHVKLLLEELSGQITVKSTPEQGTSFTITLPMHSITDKEVSDA